MQGVQRCAGCAGCAGVCRALRGALQGCTCRQRHVTVHSLLLGSAAVQQAPTSHADTHSPGPSAAPAVYSLQVQRLARLLDSVQEQRFLALPSSTAACDSCCASVQDAIFDMLMAPVAQVGAASLDAGCGAAVLQCCSAPCAASCAASPGVAGLLCLPCHAPAPTPPLTPPHPLPRPAQALQGFPQWPDWSKVSGPSVIPTFSAYPLPYITAIGEYLMTLPQLLEVRRGAVVVLENSWYILLALCFSSAQVLLDRDRESSLP